MPTLRFHSPETVNVRTGGTTLDDVFVVLDLEDRGCEFALEFDTPSQLREHIRKASQALALLEDLHAAETVPVKRCEVLAGDWFLADGGLVVVDRVVIRDGNTFVYSRGELVDEGKSADKVQVLRENLFAVRAS